MEQMKKTRIPYFTVLFLVTIFSSFVTHAGPFPPKVHRIVFIGNSITYGGTYITDIEAYFITHYPKKQFEFINVGLPSETVSGLSEEGHAGGRFPRPDVHERLARVLAQTKPDLVFVSYGMNDGIYLPFDEQRFQKFKEGMVWLHNEVVKAGSQIIHLTPPVYDEMKGGIKEYAAVLDRYSEWLVNQVNTAHWKVADIHFPMKKLLEERRKTDPSFAFANDGVHPDELGHWIMAKQILLYLGEKNVAGADNVKTAIAVHPNSEAIFKLVAQRQEMMKDAWLTTTKHTRPEMNVGLPLAEAKTKGAEIEKEIRALVKKKNE
jgi:lysophospholipase L1-like esterase